MQLSRNDGLQNNYLRVILEEVRALRAEIKKLETEIKDLKKHTLTHQHPPVV
jgi:t-SNARE complex subunit (syntaxin)